MLANFFVDPEYFNSPEASDVQVLSAGTTAVDGIYTLRGTTDGYPYYALTGQASPTPPLILPAYSVFTDGSYWYVTDSAGDLMYQGRQASISGAVCDYPWESATWTAYPSGGTAPVPTVSEYFTEVAGTWEQLTLSNQGYGVVVPWSIPGPFWNVQQTKEYVNTVVGDGSAPIPYAGTLIAGKTLLDTAPVLASAPIAVGANSAVLTGIASDISTLEADVASLNTLKAPKANPTFTGTVTTAALSSTTIAASSTITATGNVTGANLSGTNTGNVTLAGENYLSLASQVITAAAVNLSGTNVTGTMAAARMPALTGDVTTSAGAVATTIANLAVTNAKVATGIDAVKIADGSVTNTEFQYISTVTSNVQTQLDAKAALVSPVLVTPNLGTPTAGVLTACTVATASAADSDTSIASTAFVQGLGQNVTIYDITLTQSSTSAPVATVLNKTISGTLTWGYTSAGLYTLTSSATPFTANKTQVFFGGGGAGTNFSVLRVTLTSTSVITLETLDVNVGGGSVTNANGLLTATTFRVVVWP